MVLRSHSQILPGIRPAGGAGGEQGSVAPADADPQQGCVQEDVPMWNVIIKVLFMMDKLHSSTEGLREKKVEFEVNLDDRFLPWYAFLLPWC